MKIKTNLRAGKGQTQNGKTSTGGTDNTTPEAVETPAPVVVYYNPAVSRCPGY